MKISKSYRSDIDWIAAGHRQSFLVICIGNSNALLNFTHHQFSKSFAITIRNRKYEKVSDARSRTCTSKISIHQIMRRMLEEEIKNSVLLAGLKVIRMLEKHLNIEHANECNGGMPKEKSL